jgi:tetratricopeptide (TPR) repeat protein
MRFTVTGMTDSQPARLDSRDLSALVALVNQERLHEAERTARAFLQSFPDVGMLWKILGVILMRQGQHAIPALRRAAELMPHDAEVHANIGAALNDERQWQAALPSWNRALDIDPHNIEALNGLGNTWLALGKIADAVGYYRRALRTRPDDAGVHCNLSNALRQLGLLDEALSISGRGLALDPELAAAHNNLGLILAALRRHEEAVTSYQQALQINAHYGEALHNLGNALHDLGRSRDAAACYARALQLEPDSAASHCHLGIVLYELQRTEEAAASYKRALALDPNYTLARVSLGLALRRQGRVAEAQATASAALDGDPNCVAALNLLGEICADRGLFSEAEERFRSALALDPRSPSTYVCIATHRKMTSQDDDWRGGAEALLASRLPAGQEIALRYALGKYFDDIEQYDNAFSHYRQANELTKRSRPKFDQARLAAAIDAIIRRFAAASASHIQYPRSDSELPVFVVGMPRSGTSLAEQILASHPAVFGAGEVTFWKAAQQLYEQTLTAAAGVGKPSATNDVLLHVPQAYLARVRELSGDALRVVDKMPGNFLYAGLIHAVFPRARIIHMRRHPLDNCLSIYFQNFAGLGAYANDLEDLACYYREYVRITDHWRATLPATALLEVPYEALIEDQESWTRRMLDFVGLPWDPRCLNFHQTERIVMTASKWQVRQKLYSSSVGRWRNYARYLQPLQQRLAARERQ